MTISQHIPTFCEGFERESGTFETLEELERIPFIARWKQHFPPTEAKTMSWDADGNVVESTRTIPASPPFKRWSCDSEPYDRRDTLMAEFENGSFWVVGFMDKGAGEKLGLPKWVHSGVSPR